MKSFKPFTECDADFQAALVDSCDGNATEALETYETVARDGWAPAFEEAFRQKNLKLPSCKQESVKALTSNGSTLAEAIVARAVE